MFIFLKSTQKDVFSHPTRPILGKKICVDPYYVKLNLTRLVECSASAWGLDLKSKQKNTFVLSRPNANKKVPFTFHVSEKFQFDDG
jgi:hypothetical protein